MKIAFASDHGGYELKEFIKERIKDGSLDIGEPLLFVDLGTDSTESVDYPDYAKKCGDAVLQGKGDFGVVICGTGIGISISANKLKGIRCANCLTVDMARLSREHNNANMLALGGRILEPDLAVEIVKTFLTTKFDGGRHQRRIDKIE